MGNCFLAGLNVTLLKERYIFLEFSHEPVDPEAAEAAEVDSSQDNKKIPYLVSRNWKWEETYRESL